MELILTRQPPIDNAVRGVLKLHTGSDPACSYGATTAQSGACGFEEQSGASSYRLDEIKTLENAAYLVPPGTYTLTVTYSPRFKRNLPLVNCVTGRSGIRFHRGTLPEHSKGCILVSPEVEQRLTRLLTHPTILTVL